MENENLKPQKAYDPRWFIWTIVFLVVSGVALVSYIVFSSDPTTEDYTQVITHETIKR